MDIRDLARQRSLKRRLTVSLEFAISALNDVPRFPTHVTGPNGRPLSSYDLLPHLEAVLSEMKARRKSSPAPR